MKIEKQSTEDHQVKIIVELEPETLENYRRRAARKISKEAKISGFRPGKAPYEVVKRTHGEELIQKQAVDIMLDEIYPEVLEDANVEPSGPGKLDDIILDPPKLTFIVPLIPEIKLCDYRSIRQDYKPDPVTDEETGRVLHNLQRSYATAEPVDRPIQKGDLVFIKLSGAATKPTENENPDIIKETTTQMIVGENDIQPDRWPFDNFTNELIGLSENDEKFITYKYQDDSPFEKLVGQEVEFRVCIQSVKTMHLPELNDEFAKSIGEYDTIDSLHYFIKSELENNHQKEYDEQYLTELVEDIVQQSEIKYPPHMADEEVDHIIETLKDNLGKRKMDLKTYLKTLDTDQDTYIENEVKPVAVKNLERALVLQEIAKAEQIELEDGELEAAVSTTMTELKKLPDYSKFNTGQGIKKLTNVITLQTANQLLDQHLKERLKDIAAGKLDDTSDETDQSPMSTSEFENRKTENIKTQPNEQKGE